MNQTPEEKAKELMKTFKWQTMGVPNGAKTSAILCVDEIIKANPTEEVDGSQFTIHPVNEMVKCNTTNYWQQVKQELQKI